MRHERKFKCPDAHQVVQRLTEIRMAWGLTADEVAQRVGVRVETLRRYELGLNGYNPSFKIVCRWAEELGFELSLWPKKQFAASEPLLVKNRVPEVQK